MNFQLLLLLLLRVAMGLSAALDKSNTQLYPVLCKETQFNRPLGAARPLQGSVAIEADLPGDSGDDCVGVLVLEVCTGP